MNQIVEARSGGWQINAMKYDLSEKLDMQQLDFEVRNAEILPVGSKDLYITFMDVQACKEITVAY